MPRVTLRLAYKAAPAAPNLAFPDQIEVHLPIVEVALQSGERVVRALALVDTGCSIVLFPTQFAEVLGLDWRNAPTTPVSGVGGAGVGYAVDLRLILVPARHGWPARIVFSPQADAFGIPLLGHRGFLDHCKVRFNTAAREFHIQL